MTKVLKKVYLVTAINKNGEVVGVDEFKHEPNKAEMMITSLEYKADYYKVEKAYKKVDKKQKENETMEMEQWEIRDLIEVKNDWKKIAQEQAEKIERLSKWNNELQEELIEADADKLVYLTKIGGLEEELEKEKRGS
jgi:hypothetical protein